MGGAGDQQAPGADGVFSGERQRKAAQHTSTKQRIDKWCRLFLRQNALLMFSSSLLAH